MYRLRNIKINNLNISFIHLYLISPFFCPKLTANLELNWSFKNELSGLTDREINVSNDLMTITCHLNAIFLVGFRFI